MDALSQTFFFSAFFDLFHNWLEIYCGPPGTSQPAAQTPLDRLLSQWNEKEFANKQGDDQCELVSEESSKDSDDSDGSDGKIK